MLIVRSRHCSCRPYCYRHRDNYFRQLMLRAHACSPICITCVYMHTLLYIFNACARISRRIFIASARASSTIYFVPQDPINLSSSIPPSAAPARALVLPRGFYLSHPVLFLSLFLSFSLSSPLVVVVVGEVEHKTFIVSGACKPARCRHTRILNGVVRRAHVRSSRNARGGF